MSETPEGIGGRKWSLIRATDGSDGMDLMEGQKKLATLTADGAKLFALFVTVPQLWEAANAAVKAPQALLKADGVPLATKDAAIAAAYERLANMVAKAVGKDEWTKVLQAE